MLTHFPDRPGAREPEPGYEALQRSRRKQLARIICHIRDDLHVAYPRLAMPSRWLVENLLCNVTSNTFIQGEIDWEARIINALKTIRRLADASLHSSFQFTCCDGKTPLFPNEEQFDEWDLFRFCQTLLRHLDRVLNMPRGF